MPLIKKSTNINKMDVDITVYFNQKKKWNNQDKLKLKENSDPKIASKYILCPPLPAAGGFFGRYSALKSCYEQCIAIATDKGAKSIAFPVFPPNRYGYRWDSAAKFTEKTVNRLITGKNITVYLIEHHSVDMKALLEDIKHYVGEHKTENSAVEENSKSIKDNLDDLAKVTISTYENPELAAFIKAEKGESFSDALRQFLIKKNIEDKKCYEKANIDRRLFSKIFNPKLNYHPGKNTVLALAVALELTIEETKDFIAKAGYALAHSSTFDLVIEYFITHKIYDFDIINTALGKLKQKPLGGSISK